MALSVCFSFGGNLDFQDFQHEKCLITSTTENTNFKISTFSGLWRQRNFFKWAIPGLFFVYFCLFKQTLQFLQQINVKNVHPEYGAGIRTHNLRNMSLLP